MLSIIPAVLVVFFPYLPIVLFANKVQIEWVLICTGVLFIISATACVLNFIFLKRNTWSARTLAFIAMIVKLIHIPAYILFFILGISGVFLIQFIAVTVIIFLFDCIAILLSGSLMLLAILRWRKENKIKTSFIMLFSVCSFLFCFDVIFSVILYFYVKTKGKEIS